MNCFNNNRPKLSASERIKNKKSKAIFKANVIDFQKRNTFGNGKCSNYSGTVGFYNNGKLRKTNNYETLKEINRGSALCVDGTYKNCVNLENEDKSVIQKGLNACSRSNKVKITSGRDNIYTNFNGLSLTPVSSGNFFSGFPSMVSYYFGGTTNTALNQLAQGFEISMTQTDPSKSTIIIDPSNNLFGTDFCPTDMTNPNKYLAFADVNSYVVAEGYIYDTDGNPVTCESSDDKKPQIYDLAITGLFSLMNVNNGYSGNKANLVKELPYKYFTGIGFIFKTCCETGPNGEPNWWKIYIRPLLGFFKPPQLLPESIIVPNSTKIEEVYVRMSYNTNSQNLSGTRYTQGGIYETGSLSQYSSQNVDKNAAPPYGGGIGFVKKEALINLFSSTNVSIIAMMGWRGAWTGQDPSGFSKTELVVIQGAGDPCKRDLSSGNSTQQNYLVSYTPINSGIRFNIDPQIYGSSSFKIASNDNSTNSNVVPASSSGSSSSSSSSTTSNVLASLTSNEGLRVFSEGNQAFFKTTNWINNIIYNDAYNLQSDTNKYQAIYDNGFNKDTSAGQTDSDGDVVRVDSTDKAYKSVKLKLSYVEEHNNKYFTRCGNRVEIKNNNNNNVIDIKKFLTDTKLLHPDVIEKLLDPTNTKYLAFVFNDGSSIKRLGNLKIQGSLSSTIRTNWVNDSSKTNSTFQITTYKDTIIEGFGSVDSNKHLIVHDIYSEIYIILLFQNGN
jgi:hypothetical protein